MNRTTTNFLGACSILLLTACTPAHITQLRKPTESSRAEVLVFREQAFNAGGASVIFGLDKDDLVELYGDRYATIHVSEGEYTFFARSNGGDQPFTLKLKVNAKDPTCIKALPNPANFAKSLIPISHLFGNAFLLEQASCPTKAELAKFEQVPVTYKDN